jgi:hypothetical protein
MVCPRHKKKRVTYQCTHCREVMCDGCVHRLRRRGGKVHLFCPLCSNEVELIGGTKQKKKTFFALLKQTVKLPFAGRHTSDE